MNVATHADWLGQFHWRGSERTIPVWPLGETHMQFQQLESEKYFLQDIEKRISEAKKQRNNKAFHDFLTLLVGLALVPVACLLGENLPAWMTLVGTSIEGLLDIFLGNDSPISRALGL